MLKKSQNRNQISTYLQAQKDLKLFYKMWKIRYHSSSRIRLEREYQKNVLADAFANRAVPRRFLGNWKQFVKTQKEDRWREYRKSRLREAALEVLEQSKLSKPTYNTEKEFASPKHHM